MKRYNLDVCTSAPVFDYIDGPTTITPSGNSVYYESNFSNGGTPTEYEWSISGAPSSWYDIFGNGSSSAYLYFYGEADYYVQVICYNACGSDYGTMMIEAHNYKGKGKQEEEKEEVEEQVFTVYPNPVDDILTVEIDEQDVQQQAKAASITYDIRLYDAFGALRHQTTTKNSSTQINVSNLPNGFYYLHIYDGVSDKPDMKTIVVKH